MGLSFDMSSLAQVQARRLLHRLVDRADRGRDRAQGHESEDRIPGGGFAAFKVMGEHPKIPRSCHVVNDFMETMFGNNLLTSDVADEVLHWLAAPPLLQLRPVSAPNLKYKMKI